jgi:hypothetical protein
MPVGSPVISPSCANAVRNRRKRNERFRVSGHKSLESLRALNQSFRRFVCFQGFSRRFVSRVFTGASRPRITVQTGCEAPTGLAGSEACSLFKTSSSVADRSVNVNILVLVFCYPDPYPPRNSSRDVSDHGVEQRRAHSGHANAPALVELQETVFDQAANPLGIDQAAAHLLKGPCVNALA